MPTVSSPSTLAHFDDVCGIGGFSLAAKWCGIRTHWAREIDEYARKVYRRHFPDVELFRDAREPLPDGIAGGVGLYTAGWPCQPVSVAGKRLGDKDPRWLWPDIARTLRVLRPRWVLLENVPGLLIRGMGQVLGDLAACGYDAEWDCISAAAVGAPHRRDRLWVVAYRVCGGSSRPMAEREGPSAWLERNFGWNGEARNVADTDKPRLARGWLDGSGQAIKRSDWWNVEPNVGRVAHGIPHRVDRLKGLGNAIVPQVACWIMRRIVEADMAP
jgi:DNA (cytosine-5)-methyltransferase 1